MALAIRTGVPAEHWMNDPRALVTAVQLLNEADSRRR